MILSEDIAKKYLRKYGLLVPYGEAVTTAEAARALAEKINKPVVVKALIPSGGRGKAGGVRLCLCPAEAEAYAASLLGRQLLSFVVDQVLVEEAVSPTQELYVGVVTNTTSAQIEILLSLSGGMEVENTVAENSCTMHKLSVDPGDLLPTHRVKKWLRHISVDTQLDQLALILATLYRAAADYDLTLVEINPLAIREDGNFIILDCKMNVDDNALARHPELNALYRAMLNEREKKARDLKLSYVELDGNIGVLTSGAGLGMMTIDQLSGCGLTAANFLDTGGGITEGQVMGAVSLIFAQPGLAGVIVNLYGGINRMVEAAKGISGALEFFPDHPPVVVKIIGNQQEEAWALLETLPGVYVIREVQTEAAVEKLVELIR